MKHRIHRKDRDSHESHGLEAVLDSPEFQDAICERTASLYIERLEEFAQGCDFTRKLWKEFEAANPDVRQRLGSITGEMLHEWTGWTPPKETTPKEMSWIPPRSPLQDGRGEGPITTLKSRVEATHIYDPLFRRSDLILVNIQSVFDDMVKPWSQDPPPPPDSIGKLLHMCSGTKPRPSHELMWLEAIDDCGPFAMATHSVDPLERDSMPEHIYRRMLRDSPAYAVHILFFQAIDSIVGGLGAGYYWLDADKRFLHASLISSPENGIAQQDQENQDMLLRFRAALLLRAFSQMGSRKLVTGSWNYL